MTAPTAQDDFEVWFLTGSQHLYGEETLRQVAEQSRGIAAELSEAPAIRVKLVWKPVLVDHDAIRRTVLEANADDRVVGLVAWMHTFSPAKMWIAGLSALDKPLLHLHTQANVALPWATIDFDFMNLNQAAHGDREFGYALTRLSVPRKTVAGHVSDPRVVEQVATWTRAAAGWAATRSLRLARFGDNMRYVAVTEGDKTEAEAIFGVQVNTWGVNDLVAAVDAAARRTSTRWWRSTRTPTTSRPSSSAERSAISRCATAPRSSSGSGPSSTPADSGPSQPTSRTWAG